MSEDADEEYHPHLLPMSPSKWDVLACIVIVLGLITYWAGKGTWW